MLQTLIITLREGVEAALVIAIAIAYLRKIGRRDLLPAVHRAFGSAVIASFGFAWLLSRLGLGEDAYEGWTLLVSAVFVLSMVLWMNRHARGMKGDIETQLQQRSGAGSRWGIFLFVFLMIFREGVETVLMLTAVKFDTSGVLDIAGVVLGLGLAVLFGFSFVRGTIRIDLPSFFRMTTVILMVIVVQLAITGLHELSESQVLPSSRQEMALIGPIVSNEVFFFVAILALAGAMLLMEYRKRRTPVLDGLEGAALRKARWTVQRERVWMVASCLATGLFILSITAEFIYAKSTTELSAAIPVSVSNGQIRIPVDSVNDGNLHRFAVDQSGVHVRFIVIRRPDQSLVAAFDACEICGNQGYYQKGPNVICKNCASAIFVPSIGIHGGCNPIPIASQVEGGQLVIPAAKLIPGEKIFRNPSFSRMFLRFVSQSIRRSPRRKAMTVAAVAMGTAVATAMLGVMLDIGDRVNRELRSLGANLMVTPKAQSLPVEIGGISYRPVSAQDFIPEDQVPKIKSTFWQLNITGFSPSLKASTSLDGRDIPVEGVWFRRRFRGADGSPLEAGLRTVNGEWKVDGRSIDDGQPNDAAQDAMVGGAVARRLGLKPGATLPLFGQPFTVAGIVSTGGDEEDRIFVRLEVLQRLVNRPGQVDAVQVGALTKPEDEFARKDPARMTPKEYDRWYCTPYISSIAHQIEEVLPMAVARPIWRVADNEGKVLGKIRGLMLLITLAALASAGLTVWSVMATTVLERRGEIAIMQATGAGNALVAALFSTEVALEGAAGGLIGSWVGLLLAAWVGHAVFQTSLETPAMLGPVVVGAAVLASIAGAAQPLRRALLLEPAVTLRGGE